MITINEMVNAWNSFFFTPVPIYTVALFRIIFGLVLIFEAFYICRNAAEYLGPNGLVNYQRYYNRSVGKTFSLFLVFPPTMRSVYIILNLHIISLSMMIVGLFTPISVLLSFITLRSIVNRNSVICNGGDNVSRIMCFFLIFASSGKAYSLDYYFFPDSIITNGAGVMQAPWVLRLMQIQLAVIYLYTFYWKLKGSTYRNGTALYYVMHNYNYTRFKLPKFMLQKPIVQFLSWGALIIECALGTVIWIDEFRNATIVIGILFHLFIEYILSVHLFSWYMIASLLLFLNPNDVNNYVNKFIYLFC